MEKAKEGYTDLWEQKGERRSRPKSETIASPVMTRGKVGCRIGGVAQFCRAPRKVQARQFYS